MTPEEMRADPWYRETYGPWPARDECHKCHAHVGLLHSREPGVWLCTECFDNKGGSNG